MDIDKKKDQPGRSWDHIESDLKDALNTWSDLTEELAGKVSPEEEQLREIKSLLGNLRDKLKEFSEENTATASATASIAKPAASVNTKTEQEAKSSTLENSQATPKSPRSPESEK